jgi:hypothetical protein
MRRKYPIGLQDFRKIREGGYVYIDKTEVIHELVDSGDYYFLSRPRRFGKSLLVSTLKELFQGSRELFKNLWIHDHWNWEKKHPVIHLSLSKIDYQKLGLYDALNKELDEIAAEIGVTLKEVDLKSKFRELIKTAAVPEKVVILIDEYDKPIIDYLDDLAKVEENKAVFKSFYSVLKDSDEHIRLLLITGVSRFSKVSIFSDLNNLNDITLSNRFGTIAGITQEELESNFSAEIVSLQQQDPGILNEIKKWYNGYSWDIKNRVYNPFSLLNYIAEPVFRNYWFATGSPTFLIKNIQAKGEYDFENVSSNENVLGSFDPLNMLSIPLLFQTGYLTIKGYNTVTRTYQLGYPNQEVKDSLLDNLLSAYRQVYPDGSSEQTGDLLLAVHANNIPGIISSLNAIIGSIPYDHWRADTESIFHIITFLTFKKIGVDVHTEVHNNKGRCDVLVKTNNYIYVIELKRDGTAREALEQILSSSYLQPYEADPRKKVALGISFSSTERMISGFEVKQC